MFTWILTHLKLLDRNKTKKEVEDLFGPPLEERYNIEGWRWELKKDQNSPDTYKLYLWDERVPGTSSLVDSKTWYRRPTETEIYAAKKDMYFLIKYSS